MSGISIVPGLSLSTLVRQAADRLAKATTAAEILDTCNTASIVYDAGRKAAQMAKARGAHDEVVATAHRAQADALEIEADAKRKLADEYDAAQKRGEVASHGGARNFKVPHWNVENCGIRPSTSAELGLSRKQIHEARIIRDAEDASPGIVRKTLDDCLENGRSPNRAAIRKAVTGAAGRGGVKSVAPDQAAWLHLHREALEFTRWATPQKLALAKQGMIRASTRNFHHFDVRTVCECADLFQEIKAWFDPGVPDGNTRLSTADHDCPLAEQEGVGL